MRGSRMAKFGSQSAFSLLKTQVHHWLEKAAAWFRLFSDRKMRRLSAVKFQADEMRTIVGGKGQPIWVFAVIDVWSRLWPSTVVGKRSYRKTLDLLRDLSNRMSLEAACSNFTNRTAARL
jgi:hypothetical protein